MSEPTGAELGWADWLYDAELGVHIPCCSQWKDGRRLCHNGPLTGEQIATGDCGEHGTIGPDRDT